MKKASALFVLVGLFLVSVINIFDAEASAANQAGEIDTTYTASSASTAGLVIQSTGNIVVNEGSTVKRFTSSGVVDSTFASSGSAYYVSSIGAGNKFYVSGTTASIRVKRYLVDGTLDTTYNSAPSTASTRANTPNSIIEATDGSVLVVGSTAPYLVKYSLTGVLDTTFNSNVNASPPGSSGYSVALQSDGKVLIGTSGGVLKRYSTTGVYDNTFTPTSAIGTINAIQVVSDGVIVGTTTAPYLRKYDFSGVLDTAFASAVGSSLNGPVNDIAVQSSGKILIGGSFSGFLYRLSSGGLLDSAFNTKSSSSVTSIVNAIAIQSDDNIVVATTTGVKRLLGSSVAPGAPPAPTAVAGNRAATITVAAGSGVLPTGYTVYVKGDTSKNCSVSSSSGNCTISGLTNGTSYSFYATAVNVDAVSTNSPDSNSVIPVDTVAPIYNAASVNSLGTTLTLTYNESLNSTTALTGAFAVTVGGSPRSVSSVVVSGSTVQLTLASAVQKGEVVTVAYNAPSSNTSATNNAIQDTDGNDAVSLASTTVSNGSTYDVTPPSFVSASLGATGLVLTVTYNEDLNATTAATTDFSVLVDGSSATVASRAVSGSTVQLTMSTSISGSSAVTFAYNAPSSNSSTSNSAVQDTAGNDAASLSATSVTNNSTQGPPLLISAEVLPAGNQMKMTWSKTLGSTYPLNTAFTILVNGSPVTVTGTNTVTPSNYFTFNLSQTITTNQTVTVSYIAPASDSSTTNNAVQDSLGNDALAFTNSAVTNSSTIAGDTTAPTLLSASLNTAGTVLSLSYNETLNATTADKTAFTVLVNGVTYSVGSVAVSSSVVQLTLGSAVEAGKTVTVAYTAPTTNSWTTNTAIQDSAGNDAASLTAQAVTNNSTAGPDIAPPTLSSVSAIGTLVTLSFNESLKSTPTPPLNAFTVFVGETPVTPSAITISGSSVLLTLPSSVPGGTVVQVSYLAPAVNSANTNAAVQDVTGNDALSFNGTTNPPTSGWNWTTAYDATTNAPVDCDGAGSINRAKQTTLPNGVTYTVAVTGPYLCINEVTESLAQRGGQPGDFVATGLVTEPGLKLTTTNVNCPADSTCTDRGTLTLSFGQPVKNPVFSFAGWGGRSSGTSWSEMTLSASDIASGVTISKLSGTNIYVSPDGTFVGDNGAASSVSCTSGAVCGSLQINGTISSVSFIVQMQTSGGTGYKDAWNLTASMAEDFGLVPTTYESSGVASHGVGALKLGATVIADQASALYATTNADAVARWTSLANNAKKDDGVAAWVDSPTITFVPGAQYSTTVALGGVERTANLCAWIDFNRDEVFSYNERSCAVDPVTGATSATLTWTVPADVGSGITYARVRLSYDPITVPTGKVGTGEVEDYSLVLPANNLPAAVNDTSINGQDVNQTITPLTNDQFEANYPANNATLKLCGSGQTPNGCNVTTLVVANQGTFTVNADGTVTFDPLPNFTGTATPVTYQITDTYGSPRTTSGTITPTVTPRPSATADSSLDLLNIAQSKNPLANDSAGDSTIPLVASSVRLCTGGQTPPSCNATSVSVTGGTYTVNTTTGIVTFTPTNNWFGTAAPVTYQVSDSINQVASTTYTPTVIAAPAANNDTSSGAWNVNQTISPFGNDTNASGHPLGSLALCGLSPVELPDNCSQPTLTTADGTYIVNTNGTVTFDPLPTFTGTVTQPVTYQAKDDLNQYVSALITPSVTPPPTPTAVPDTTSNLVNVTQTKNVLANDTTIDPLITLDATSVRLCSSGQVKPNCNATSVAVSGGTYSVDTSTGIVSFTPDTNWSGTPTPVAYQVTDSTNQKVSSTYAPTVTAKPTATNDTSSGAWNVNQTISPFLNDSISTGHPLSTLKLCGSGETPNTCSVTTLVVENQGTYSINANGTVTFDPLPTFTGTATAVRYQAVDDLGQYVNATITPSVTPPPAPVAAADTSNNYLNVVQTKNPLDNDTTSDPLITLDEASVRLCGGSQVKPNCTATSVVVTGGAYSVNTTTGIISFTPDNNWSGTAPAVTYQVTDSTNQTVSATYIPTVYPKPSATNDTSTGAHDANQTISPFGNDSFGGNWPAVLTTLKLCGPSETPNNCTQASLTVSGQGTFTVNVNGTVTFDPLPTFSGTATPVTYQATDTLGQFVDATITPTVTPPPAPIATPETKAVIPGGTATFTTITGTSGLATGTQLQTSGAKATCLITPGSNPATCDADNVVTIAGEGTFTLNPTTGVVTFVADANATAGTKTALTYRVTDVTGQTATSTLTPVIPQPPVANPDTNTGNWDANQTISPLTNDTPGAVSAPLVASTVKLCGVSPVQTPNNCTLTSLTIANEGTYTVNANGTVTFDPLPTFNGTATAVKYQVADILGQVTNTTITPTVLAPRAPTAAPDTNTGNWDTNQTISPLTNDTPGEPTAPLVASTVKLCGVAPSAQTPNNCTQTSLTIANQGTYTVNANGTVTFDPLPSFTGTATAVKYQATDTIGQTINTTITPTVLAPPAPVASPGTVSLIAGGTKDFAPIFGTNALAAKATGGPDLTNSTVCIVDPATPTVCGTTLVTIAGEGTFTLNPTTGVVTYTALSTATAGAKTAISYKITDALGVTVTSTLTPTIIPKPTARPDTSRGVMEQTQTLSPVGNDSPGEITYPLDPKTVLLCGATETAPTCTQTTVTVAGEGTYVVQSNGTVKFTPETTYYGTATPVRYIVKDSLGQVATSTLTPTVVPPPAPITELDTGIAEQGSPVVLSPWSNDNGGVVPAGVTGTVELVPNSIRLCGSTDNAPTCTRTSLTTDDGTYTVNTTSGQVVFVHRQGFMGTVTQPVTYQIANNWTGLSGIGITTNILIPTIIPPAPPVAVSADPYAVVDVSTGAWDTNQIISIFTNDVFPGSEASMVSIKLCTSLDGQMATGSVSKECAETTLTVPGEGTYTVNADGTVTFDPLPSFHGTATPIRYQAVDKLGRFVNSTITPTVDAPPVIIATSNELPATGQNPIREIVAVMMLLVIGMVLRRRSVSA